MTSMDFTMGNINNIETKLSKSLDDIIKTGGGSKPAGAPKNKKTAPVKIQKAKVLTVPRPQQQQKGGKHFVVSRGSPATRGKGNVQARLQKVGSRPAQQGFQANKGGFANGRIQAQQAASQAARESTLAKRRGMQQTTTIKSRLTPVNPITAARGGIASRMRPVQQQQQKATVLHGVQSAPASRNSEPTKFKITIQNDMKGNGKARANQVNMPGSVAQNNKPMLRGTGNAAGARLAMATPNGGGSSALPGQGKTLSERFGMLSKSARTGPGLRRGGPGAKQVTRNAAGVVMPF